MHIKLEQGIRDCQIMTDTYSDDLIGYKAVLHFMARQNRLLSKTLVIADAADGLDGKALLSLLHACKINKLILIGTSPQGYRADFGSITTHFYPDTAHFLKSDVLASLSKSVIAIKNSTVDLTPVAQHLYERCHDTVLEVDLDAIAHNLQFFRSQLAPHTQVLAMVKALSYGSSDYEVAQVLAYAGVDYLAVAYTDEGVALREHGITVPIMVMSAMPHSFHQLVHYQLEPVIYSLELMQALQAFLDSQAASLNVHIEVETGMHRLGLSEQAIAEAISILQATSAMQPKTVMSQLAASGTAQHDAYTHQQARLFQQRAEQLEKGLGRSLKKHLLNTAGIIRFPPYHFDMVRLGIGLYGVGIDPAIANQLQVASRLKTTIIQIKPVAGEATVGYERKGKVQGLKQIATLAIGYADGFFRALGNGQSQVWIHGQLAPVIGHVCMDMVMVDVTHIDAKPGDEVILFGKEHPIAHMAESAHTIAYELLTNVGERVRRVYYTR